MRRHKLTKSHHSGISPRPLLASAAAAAVLGLAFWAAREVPVSLGSLQVGRRARGERRERIKKSPQFYRGAFHNPQPARTFPAGSALRTIEDMVTSRGRHLPSGPVPLVSQRELAADLTGAHAAPRPTDPLNIIWYGHASCLIEMGGRRILLDPVWGKRASPSSVVGPKRIHPAPMPSWELPQVDAIVISHDHYDHLDYRTVRSLLRTQNAPFVVPLGVGAHLERWQVPEERIIELDWEESTTVAGVQLIATPARHFSGRGLSRDTTLWSSWVIRSGDRRVFYSGDTGYFPGFAAIGAEYGPFAATLLQIGAYGPGWPDIHLNPEDGVRAHVELGGGLLIPVHWATFDLSVHGWADPVDRVWLEAKARDVTLAIPRPGELVDVDHPPAVDPWWQEIARH